MELCDAAMANVETCLPLVEGMHTTKEAWQQTVRHAAMQVWDSFDDLRNFTAACPRVMLAIPTYKRNEHIFKTLPI